MLVQRWQERRHAQLPFSLDLQRVELALLKRRELFDLASPLLEAMLAAVVFARVLEFLGHPQIRLRYFELGLGLRLAIHFATMLLHVHESLVVIGPFLPETHVLQFGIHECVALDVDSLRVILVETALISLIALVIGQTHRGRGPIVCQRLVLHSVLVLSSDELFLREWGLLWLGFGWLNCSCLLKD